MDLLDFCGISIHAPRTGSDQGVMMVVRKLQDISIHAPRTGSDMSPSARGCQTNVFQSTLPARGATFSRRMLSFWTAHFNPRSPHGERLTFSPPTSPISSISTHAPRTGSDATVEEIQKADSDYFNPRSPHGERLQPGATVSADGNISTHAPRTGSDSILHPHIAHIAISTHAPRTGSDF